MPNTSIVRQRQGPLVSNYRQRPEDAVIVKRARTVTGLEQDPFHTAVTVDGPYPEDVWSLGIDHKIGGDHDLPNPAEMLLAALAGCHASTLRMVADNLQVAIESLEVVAYGEIDSRGCLAMSDQVAVGFETIHLDVHLAVADGADPSRVALLEELAERLCVTADTLRRGADLRVSYHH